MKATKMGAVLCKSPGTPFGSAWDSWVQHRQRKKEQMRTLQGRADVLKEEQLWLRQVINDKTTANILVGFFSQSSDAEHEAAEDPCVEESWYVDPVGLLYFS
jgi:hypothetical protein